jgi:hypothetical protein
VPEKPTIAVDHLEAQITAYLGIDRQIKELTEMRDRIKQAVTEALGDNELGTVRNRTAVRYTRYTQRRLSPELVRKKFSDEDLGDCYVESVIRKFTVTG